MRVAGKVQHVAPERPRLGAMKQVSRQVGLPYTSVRDAALRGEFQFFRFGRSLYIEWNEVDRWLATKRAGAA